ncbi:apses-domain-containing protein, partial [Aureobasidium melanogenum]
KLALPSISHVQSRGFEDQWYQPANVLQATSTAERLPALSQLQTFPSVSSSPRGSSITSAEPVCGADTATSYSSSFHGAYSTGLKTPSPDHTSAYRRDSVQSGLHGQSIPITSYDHNSTSCISMNQTQPYMDVSQSHMSSSIPSSAPPPGLGHYASYHQPQPISSQSHPYGSSPSSYSQYYTNGLAPLHHPSAGSLGSQMVPQSQLPLPTLANSVSPSSAQGQYSGATFDTTGQVAPPGMKPRVTATLWEDEGSLCFQVEANGICVARREDNHMINGTKLLNVAGMTRGRRDGILKSEKNRHVVKIGPMHLKGVWIPFDRALEFANKEKITEKLYPLFVHNIGALLYHPSNSASRTIGGATSLVPGERRRPEDYMRAPVSQPPAMPQAHSMGIPQPPHSLAPQPNGGRPGLDRAHTFPTPPTSASSMMGIGNSEGSYQWSNQPPSTMQQQQPTQQPLAIDTNMSNRSVPTTPATTPPGSAMHSMPPYQTSQGYDNGRQLYSAPSQPSQYGPRYGQLQPSPYIKNEMAPPARTGVEADHAIDQKPQDGYTNHSGNHDDAEGEHEGEYTHASGPYGGNRASYAYATPATTASLHSDQTHMSSDMTGSPHHKASGGATPRTTNSYHAGYTTPQRPQQLQSNLFSVMSDNRPNGPDMYGQPGHVYGQGYQPVNGMQKRMRDDDVDDRYNEDSDGLKRRKTVREGSAGIGRPRSVLAGHR